MQQLMRILAIIALIATLVGSLFKIMHWPGADYLFVGGNLLFVILGIIWLLIKKRDTIMTLVGVTLLLLFAMGAFKIQHWPLGNILFWASVAMVSITAAVLYSKKE